MTKKYRHPKMITKSSFKSIQICELCHRVSDSLYLVDVAMACKECWTARRLDPLPPKSGTATEVQDDAKPSDV